MITIIRENMIFILAMTSAVITFLIFLIEKLVKKQKLKFLLIFAALGFLAITGRQIIEVVEKKNQALLDAKKEEIIGEILSNTRSTLTLVEQLSEELSGISPERIGIELVQAIGLSELHQFFKGSPSLWHRYSQWLFSLEHQQKKVPCLSFMLNANNHYNINLILVYLFTNGITRQYISDIISYDWHSFPNDHFIEQFGFPDPEIKYVLFYDGETRKLAGYADANLFAKELLLIQKTGKTNIIENIFNRRDPSFKENMKEHITSFRSNVSEGKDAYLVAKEMLNRKINELAVVYEEKIYLVSLSNIVKIIA